MMNGRMMTRAEYARGCHALKMALVANAKKLDADGKVPPSDDDGDRELAWRIASADGVVTDLVDDAAAMVPVDKARARLLPEVLSSFAQAIQKCDGARALDLLRLMQLMGYDLRADGVKGRTSIEPSRELFRGEGERG